MSNTHRLLAPLHTIDTAPDTPSGLSYLVWRHSMVFTRPVRFRLVPQGHLILMDAVDVVSLSDIRRGQRSVVRYDGIEDWGNVASVEPMPYGYDTTPLLPPVDVLWSLLVTRGVVVVENGHVWSAQHQTHYRRSGCDVALHKV